MLSLSTLKTQWLPRGLLSLYCRNARRAYAIRPEQPSFPTVPSCPSPTCSCSAEIPELPSNLAIDHTTKLNGTMAPYAEQVLLCTGKDDWASKIVEENSGDNVAAQFDRLLGRNGLYANPYHNISVLNSSFPSSVSATNSKQGTSAYLLPSFKYVPFLSSFADVDNLIKAYLLPKELHLTNDPLSSTIRERLTRDEAYKEDVYGVQDISNVLVLICGHGGRDARCGIYGPVLKREFEKVFEANKFGLSQNAVDVSPTPDTSHAQHVESEEHHRNHLPTARVGLISHIGGHKFAGNAIIYLPPTLKTQEGGPHALAGCGIWYGRVEPKHVDGIVKETILGGKVIEELFRGGIRPNREVMRL